MALKKRDCLIAALALLTALGIACSASNPDSSTAPNDGGVDATAPPAIQQTVGATGATIRTPEGVSIEIPPGALVSDTSITVTITPSATPPDNANWASAPYTFGPAGTHFVIPITITLPFTLPEGAKATHVGIATAADGSNDYVALETRLVDDTHVQAVTTHFSKYGAYLAKCKFTSDCALGLVCDNGYCERDKGLRLCRHDIDCAGGITSPCKELLATQRS